MDYEKHIPSSPSRPPQYGLSFTTVGGGLAAHGFCTIAGMSSFLRMVMQYGGWKDEDIRWRGSRRFEVGGIEVKGEKLEAIWDHGDGAGGGRLVELPWPYPAWAARIAGAEEDAFIMPKRVSSGGSGGGSRGEGGDVSGKRDRGRASRKARKRGGGSAGAGDGVTIAELAESVGMSGSKARKILRDRGIPKPYVWAGDEVNNIVRMLKG